MAHTILESGEPYESTVYKMETQKSWWCSSSLSPKAWQPGVKSHFQGKRRSNASAQVRQSEYFFSLLFVLFMPSKDWIMPTNIGKGILLYSICWFRYFIGNTSDITHKWCYLIIWAPCDSLKLTHGITITNR